MSPREAYDLIKDVEADYIAMARDLNALKRCVKPIDPWSLPLVERMELALRDLAFAANIPDPRRKQSRQALSK